MLAETIEAPAWLEGERRRRAENVRIKLDELVCWVEGPAQKLSLDGMERELLLRLFALGGALVALWLVLRVPTRFRPHVRDGRARYSYRGLGWDVVRTRLGEFRVPRPVYALVHGKGAAAVAPFDRAIGLVAGRMSLGVHLIVGYLAAKMPFDEVTEVLGRLGGCYVPSKRAMLGIVDHLGPQAREFVDDMPAPDDDGEVLVVQIDEKGAPMIGSAEHALRCRSHRKVSKARRRDRSQRAARRMNRRSRPRVRRKKGEKSRNKRMATVAAVYTLRKTRSGKLEGPINKRVIATFRGRRHLFTLALREAKKRGYGRKPTYFLADGALGLWALWKEYFPRAIPCVDWYHVCEYLWKAGGTVFSEGSAELAAWVAARKDELRQGRIDEVLDAMNELRRSIGRSGPGTKGHRARLAASIRYIENHRDYLRYDELLAADLDIATGLVEGAIHHVVGQRLDGSMMRWSRERAEHVLALRCIVVNRDWDSFEQVVAEAHSRQRRLAVDRITPERPQEPYDAVRKAA